MEASAITAEVVPGAPTDLPRKPRGNMRPVLPPLWRLGIQAAIRPLQRQGRAGLGRAAPELAQGRDDVPPRAAAAGPRRAAGRGGAPPKPGGGSGGVFLLSARALEPLARGLPRLQALLAALPPEPRRAAVEGLSPPMRAVLLRHVELGKAGIRPVASGDPRSEAARGPCGGERRADGARGGRTARWNGIGERRCVRRCGVVQKGRSTACPPEAAAAGGGGGGGVCTIRTTSGPRHFARITVAGILAYSRYTRHRDEAARALARLARLREVTVGATGGGEADEERGLRERLRLGLTEAELAEGASGGQLRYRVTVDARRWIGRVLYTPQLDSAGEALDLWQRFTDARAGGWPALRREWLLNQCQTPQVHGRRGCMWRSPLTMEDMESGLRDTESQAVRRRRHLETVAGPGGCQARREHHGGEEGCARKEAQPPRRMSARKVRHLAALAARLDRVVRAAAVRLARIGVAATGPVRA